MTRSPSDVQYEDIVERARDGFILHTGGTITFANKAARGMLGCGTADDPVGHAMTEFLPQPWIALVHDELVAPGSIQVAFVERALRRMDGVSIAMEVTSIAVISRGVPSVEMTLRVAQVHDIEPPGAVEPGPWAFTPAAGRLAEGFAHDINNALAIITGSVSLLRGGTPGQPPAELADILAAAERASQVVADLLALTMRDVHRPTPVQVNDLVRAAADRIAHDAPGSAHLDLRLAAGLPDVLADPITLTRALVAVAGDALRAAPGHPVVVTSEAVAQPSGAEDVRIQVREAAQLAAAALEGAFEPYALDFEARGRSPLALAVALGVVTRIGGTVALTSTAAEGTRVTIDLHGCRPGPPPWPGVTDVRRVRMRSSSTTNPRFFGSPPGSWCPWATCPARPPTGQPPSRRSNRRR